MPRYSNCKLQQKHNNRKRERIKKPVVLIGHPSYMNKDLEKNDL